jgi:hypothetical protein
VNSYSASPLVERAGPIGDLRRELCWRHATMCAWEQYFSRFAEPVVLLSLLVWLLVRSAKLVKNAHPSKTWTTYSAP